MTGAKPKAQTNGNWLDNAQGSNWRAVTWEAIEALVQSEPSADELDRFLDQFEAVLELHSGDFGQRDGDLLLTVAYRMLYATLHVGCWGPEGKLKYEDARTLVFENSISPAIKRHRELESVVLA